jgi:hypothetical protein
VGYCYPSRLKKTLCKVGHTCPAGHERINFYRPIVNETHSCLHTAYLKDLTFTKVYPLYLRVLRQLCTHDTVCNAAMQHCTQCHLYTAVSQENAF